MKRLSATLLALFALSVPGRAADTEMTKAEVQSLARAIVPADKDAAGWGADIASALDANGIRRSRSNLCSVMAVIGQESTFTANPEVKGLGQIAERQIKAKLSAFPVLPRTAAAQGINWFLATRPSPQKSYLTMIRAARTERDLDLVYRNMVFFLFREYATSRILNTATVAHRIDAANPVSTLGSMQVSAAFVIAEVERAKNRRLGASAIWKLRDELYTRRGGIEYGTRMLLGYRAEYPSRLYVFADYNAGRYASRNAAFQHMVATLSGKALALDGDLLIYDGGTPKTAAGATEQALQRLKLFSTKALRADLLHEKDFGFRDTATYAAVAEAFTAKTGKPAPYAMLPRIDLKSPKIRHHMTTAMFATSVMRRYDRCMGAR
ncbi:DUF1615 family protein [Aestuariivirga sp.]|uniref:DUF1615 family protein n=1 Tax=Aestuariivirga sp. TaxID=2650926 RepID=UPI003BAC79A5